MIRFAAEKLGLSLVTLWGVATLVFFLFTVVPGDSAQMMLGKRDDPAALAAVKAKYGLDQPLHVQYGRYLRRISPVDWADGPVVKVPDFGESYQRQGQKVTGLIGATFPNTALLASVAIGFAVVVGMVLGAVAAYSEGRWLDKGLLAFSSLGMSLPSFFTAVLFAWVFAFLLGPWTGLHLTGSLFEVDDYSGERFVSLRNLVLPAFTLGIRPIGVVVQLTRKSILETTQLDFVRTARAKGLPEWKVLLRHVLPVISNPIITTISGWFASLLAGAVFVEIIFGWNGMGKLLVEALNTRDLPVTMGCVLVIAFVFVVLTTLVDVIYAILDPRVRAEFF
ncbi:MAG: Dipeptide transport system permease protein DppB [Cryomorphaceae bacterium]|nr:MAG: Dipeptide transport system permease protein DppB [Cryomorphaceae bacterium]